LVEDELSAETWQRLRECTNGTYVLGSGQFEQQIAAMVGRRTWKGSPGRPQQKDAGEEQQRPV
jgi:putative transposase